MVFIPLRYYNYLHEASLRKFFNDKADEVFRVDTQNGSGFGLQGFNQILMSGSARPTIDKSWVYKEYGQSIFHGGGEVIPTTGVDRVCDNAEQVRLVR